jgi:hypothetical protein
MKSLYPKSLILIVAAIACLFTPIPTRADGNFKNFSVAVYIPVAITRQMKDPRWLQQHWSHISSQLHVDKVYIETYRSRQIADEDSIEPIKKFFTDQGIRVAGGLALQDVSQAGQFRSFSYADPDDRKFIQSVVELTARHFNEIILDDFYFYSTKTDADIAAKGDRTWTDYRLAAMDDASQNLLIKPARAVNPNVKIIIKFPNWYEHFQGMGYDLAREPQIFDGIYTGTETRDPLFTEQHLQAYESYNIMRYFDNIAPNRNGGGWIDTFDVKTIDRYAEQLWGTAFAKPREIMLFNFAALEQPAAPGNRDQWQDLPTSFNYSQFATGNRQITAPPPPTMAKAADYSLRQVDAFLGQLGNPIGIQGYRPPHATGEDYLHNYLGMIGIPIDLHPDFPTNAQTILLTESAKFDPDIVQKIKSQLTAGKSVIITSGLLRALQNKGFDDICELRFTDRKAIITDFQGSRGRPLGHVSRPAGILIPQIDFLTNDAWMLLTGIANCSGYPILLMDRYSTGILYVLTIPDNFADLYDFPPEALAPIRRALLANFPAILNAPSQVSLFAYDNNTFIVESYLPTPTYATLELASPAARLRDLQTNWIITGHPNVTPSPTSRPSTPPKTLFNIQLPAHSYQAFSAEP